MNAAQIIKKKSYLVLIITILMAPTIFAQTKRVRPIAGHQVFSARLMINPASGQIVQDPVIEVQNGRIMRVGEKNSFPIPQDIEFVDFGDRVIIPKRIASI